MQMVPLDSIAKQMCMATMQCSSNSDLSAGGEAVPSVENWLPSWEPEELRKQRGDDPDVSLVRVKVHGQAALRWRRVRFFRVCGHRDSN